jgi:competence protein ComEA
MNPFLHETAGRPAGGSSGAIRVLASVAGAPLPDQVAGLSRLLTAAGIAALTWVGTAGAVDLNTATLDQLRGIRGIGPKTAQIILDERARGGRYLSFADLSDRVRGIGPRRAQSLQSAGLTIDGGGTRLSGKGADARTGSPAGSPRAPSTGAR